MTRVAVQVGRAWTRVAAEGRLVAELPSSPAGAALTALFDGPVDELVVVRSAGVRPPVGVGMPARVVRDVPAAVAALTQCAAAPVPATTRQGSPDVVMRHPTPSRLVAHAVVVDVGHGGAEIADVRAGRVVAIRRLAVGGARLDAATAAVLAGAGATATQAEARRVREALSLLPQVRGGTPPVVVRADHLRAVLSVPLAAVVDAVCAVVAAAGPGRSPLVLLIGGVARTPLLAELLDAAGVGDVRVAERPDAAAVTGALLFPEPVGGEVMARLPVRRAHRPTIPSRAERAGRPMAHPACTGVVASAPGASAGTQPGRGTEPVPALASAWLPPVLPTRHRRSRAVLGALAAAAGLVGLLAAGAALPPAIPQSAATAPAGDLVQYGYAVRLPPGWAHTGGLPERRRSLITPTAAPDGTDLISVERTPLGYDADDESRRARLELRAEFSAAVEGGAPLSGFDDEARYAGRPVVSYRETGSGTTGDVDWYIVLDGDAQLSVGCRHTAAGTASVGTACATVVGSLHRIS